MNDEGMKSLWNQSKQDEPRLNRDSLKEIVGKSARSGWGGLRVNVWVFAMLLLVALVFSVLNTIGSSGNSGWFTVHAGLTLIALALLILNLRVLRPLRSLGDPSEELPVLLRRQLRFFHTTFEWWMWVAPVTCWLLSFSVSVWMENQRGQYHIHHVVEFVAVSAAMVFGTYAITRLGYLPLVQRSLAALHDLEAQVTEGTHRVQRQRKYWIAAMAVLVILLTVSVAWGIATWLAATR